MARISEGESQTIQDIATYHNDVVDSVTRILTLDFRQSSARFVGWSLTEFNLFLRGCIDETEVRSSLTLMAAVEAAFRVDSKARIRQRLKDPLSRELRAIYKGRGEKLKLNEELLPLWMRHYPASKHLMSELRSKMKLRHWIAHGRYWKRPGHGSLDYVSIYNLADRLLSELPLLTEAP